MRAGREMDAAIAERIFGWQWFNHPEKSIRYFRPEAVFRYGAIAEGDLIEYTDQLPHYSTDIGAAFLVIHRMRELGWSYAIYDFHKVESGRNLGDHLVCFINHSGSPAVNGHTLEDTICRAALKALES